MSVYPAVRADLDKRAKEGRKDCDCGAPWEAHLMELSQSCHPGIGLILAYHPNSGCLLLTCPACKNSFGMVQVAKHTDDIFKGMENAHVLGMIVALFENAHPDAPDASESETPDSLDPLDPSDPSRN